MKKILVIQTASIGDVILATALAERLHLSFPEAMIDLMVKKENETLFAGHPFLNQVITWDKITRKYLDLFQIIRQVRKTKYDLVINVQRFFLTGMITVLSGAFDTRGFRKNPFSILFTHRAAHLIGNNVHEVNRNHSLINDFADSENILPRLYPTASDEITAGNLITGEFYTISPASLWNTKQYPVEKWLEFIREIPQNVAIYLLGAPGDYKQCQEIIARSGHPGLRNYSGKLTLLQSAALMKKARMNFTNDSAPVHLASAVNAPVTVIFCSTVPEFGFGPLSTDSDVVEISEKLPCRPCGLHGYKSCPEQHFKCGFNIDIAQLIKRL
jgi:ADP-heptose:LPS heptosyltransferase